LIDLLLEGSVVIRKENQLSKMEREKRIPFLIDMLQDCIVLDTKMEEFLHEFELFEGGLLYWAVPSKSLGVTETKEIPFDDEELFYLSYEFPTVRIGTTMMLSWASMTILWSGLCHIYEGLDQLTTLSPTADGKLEGQYTIDGQSRTFQLPPSTRFKDFPTLARNVCQSAEFCLRDEIGIPSMIAPLTMVIDALRSWPGLEKEIAWARSMLLEIRNRGMEIVKYLPRA
jgi:hypothetical protein